MDSDVDLDTAVDCLYPAGELATTWFYFLVLYSLFLVKPFYPLSFYLII
jgi:hypothetical protein